jgi:hypothetical protein
VRSLIIHGHFYQPPRENPWTGAIDPEDSARPMHDWNERVHAECYRPNAFARIFDSHGRIEQIVNNYAGISFNIGPTLLAWLEIAHPETYARILSADRESVRRRRGHGNAIAQAYNHAILPLCNPRDRRTQIRWGITDFRHRFGREPEAMWLPETACNAETLDALIDAGMRFVILSPYQAERIRPLDGGEWQSVADGSIDPRMAYRAFHQDRSGRSIAIFFYDAAAARAIAFEGALASSQNLLDRLELALGELGLMTNVATDGESYGHHFHFGDRSLAYALEVEGPARGLEATNYGEFLERHPPFMEVEIKAGPGGEGTSWSCAHGVGRWYRDCGCHTGGGEGWNQAWRGPMRAAFDLLRDEAARYFEEEGGALFRDPWRTRDEYIRVLLDRGATRTSFLTQQAGRRLTDAELSRGLKLLEMQRHAMLMYTSCGWFFSDISGIEAVQVMKYAARVMDLMADLGVSPPHERVLERLAEARSNIAEIGTGADIFRRMVPTVRATPKRIAAHVAITGLGTHPVERGTLGDYRFERLDHRQQRHGRLTLATSRLTLEAPLGEGRADFAVAALHLGGLDFYCSLRPFADPAAFQSAANELWNRFNRSFLPALLRLIQEHFGPDEFGLEDVLPDGRVAICEMVFGDLLEGFISQFTRLHDEYNRAAEMVQEAGLPLPREARRIAEFTLGYRFESEIQRLADVTDPQAYGTALSIAELVARRGYQIDLTTSNEIFTDKITSAVRQAIANPRPDRMAVARDLILLARRLGLQPNLDAAQEEVYFAMVESGFSKPLIGDLALALGFAPELRRTARPLVMDASAYRRIDRDNPTRT